jgi:hypothetical protein
VLPRFVVCYDQPVNGAVLGPISAPDASAIVARYGSAWVMTLWDGGYCFKEPDPKAKCQFVGCLP